MRSALLVRLGPGVDRGPGEGVRVRDIAGWVRCPAIAGDAELGPLPLWNPSLLGSDIGDAGLDTVIDPGILAAFPVVYAGAPVLLAELDDEGGPGWVILFGPVLPTAWVPTIPEEPPPGP